MCLVILLSVQMSGAAAFADNANASYYTMNLEVRENIISHYVVDCQAYQAQGGVKLHYRYNAASENQKPRFTEGDVLFSDLQDDDFTLTVPQAAAQIAEPTELTVYDENGEVVDSITYSAVAYCEKVIAMSDTELSAYTAHGDALKRLCKALITYGKAAQAVFSSYGTTAIDSDYAEELGLADATYTPASSKTDSAAVSFNSSAFLCTAAAQMRFYYTAAEEPSEAPTLAAPDGVVAWNGHTNKNGTKRTFIQVDNIKPTDFDEPLSITYGGANITMSVLDYAGKLIGSNASEANVRFAQSLIVFNREADAYFIEHAFGDWTVTAAPTCTEAGEESRTCSHCGATETNVIPALGHDLGDWMVVTPAAIGVAGERRRTCSRCDYYESEAIPALTANIETKLPHVGSCLYRAGNANNIAMGSLFRAIDDNQAIDSAAVTVNIENIAGNANGTFTANTSDWTAGTVKLTGTGVVKLTVKQSGTAVATLYLEAVAGTNYAEGATLGNITANNAVLLGDVNCKKITIGNSKTLYGNGFSITDARTDFSGAGNAYITMNGGGSIDNAKLLGEVYPTMITSGQENQYYAPGVWITGDANIYNSYVSETKNAVQIDAGTVYFENSTFAGGTIANIDIGGGDVTLKNCITKTTDRNGLKGLGIRVKTANCKLHLIGSFAQYNWLKKSELPSAYSGLFSSVYNDAAYAYNSTYVNMGVFFFTDTGSITQTEAAGTIDDQTSNTYGYIQKTAAGYTATVYTAKASMGSDAMLNPVAYDETVNGQYPIPAANTFDYTNKNYIAKTEGSNRYCYYDSTTKQVMISFDKENASSSFSWDPMILTATKNGNTLSYTVSMNGTDYTNKSITFTENGDYTVTYTYTDPYNYGPDGTPFSKTYTKTVDINVTAVEPDDVTYNASFAYDGAAGNYAAKKVIGTDSKTYVMPDVSATSATIGKTTVAGQTVYYPIVTVNPTGSNGNTAYSSGKIYYFAPVFSELHIIDYNQETGAQQYEYSKSTSTWPHGKSATTGPDTNYFTCASGEKVWSGTSPYARSMNSQYYKYGKNNLGVCYTSTEIEKDNTASTHLVQYHYVSNDGTTYYYYIQYQFGAATYNSCVTDGALVTMADGTQKPIEDVKVGDMVMTWSLWNGCYEAQPVVMHWYHGTDEWRVLTLHFSDGTEVRTIKEHGFFDVDKNTYAYVTEDNVASYIGDRFIRQLPDGTNTEVTLTDYTVSHETVGSYSIQTAFNENFMVEGMLSMTGEDYRGRFEYFAIGDGMQYDAAKMQADIEQYGLYSYEDFSDYLTPEQFAMFNGQYFKVLVGKGVLTYEDILDIIHTNLSE